jgi:hypothetical protein
VPNQSGCKSQLPGCYRTLLTNENREQCLGDIISYLITLRKSFIDYHSGSVFLVIFADGRTVSEIIGWGMFFSTTEKSHRVTLDFSPLASVSSSHHCGRCNPPIKVIELDGDAYVISICRRAIEL